MLLLSSFPTNNLNDRFRVAAEMLIAGVAFQKSGTLWEVYSHAGDDLGTLSTFMVCETACLLKKMGFQSDGLSEYGGNITTGMGCITFGRKLNFTPEVCAEVEEMMDRRWRRPVHLT